MLLYLLSICELFVAHVTFTWVGLIINVAVKVAGSIKHPVTGMTLVLSACL